MIPEGSTRLYLKRGVSGRALRIMSLSLASAAGLIVVGTHAAQATSLYDGSAVGNGLEITLDTTLSYTGIVRTNNPSARLTASSGGPADIGNANGSEGDINFAHGLVSDEFEITPVLDIKDGNYGAHFSGDAYLNTSYLGTNQNNQPGTLNPISVAKNTDFTSATRNVEGLNAQVLDAFAYGTQYFGADQSQSITLKAGRQTLLWGQSLFLSNNGIAAGMAPFDIQTADNNPDAQTQQIILPTGQVVLTYQPNSVLTLQGYYQFEWEHDYLEGVGAYFSSADLLDKGGESLILAQIPGFGYIRALRTKDLSPPVNNGEFGASAQLSLGNYDLGFFGIRYDSKSPTVYINESTFTYNLVYPRDIWIEATSLSTTVGAVNVAGEVSFRQHMPLVDALGIQLPNNTGNANSDPLYPVGDTWAGQVSALYLSPAIPFDPGGVQVQGEVGFNHLLKVTRNAQGFGPGESQLSQGRTSTAADMQGEIEPTYYDFYPNLEVQFPIGLAYNVLGRSAIDPTENHGTGSVNFGVTATYKVRWIASLTFNDEIGAANPNLSGEPSVADRNYVLFNLQHTF